MTGVQTCALPIWTDADRDGERGGPEPHRLAGIVRRAGHVEHGSGRQATGHPRDVQLMVVAVIFAGIFAFVADLSIRRWDFPFGFSPYRPNTREDGRREDGAGLAIIVAFAIIALSWGVSILIRFAISRSREYLADAGSVELTKNPDAMISALRKIEAHAAIPTMPSRMHAFFIESPAIHQETGWLASHPSVDDRVAALIKFAGGHDVEVSTERVGPWG